MCFKILLLPRLVIIRVMNYTISKHTSTITECSVLISIKIFPFLNGAKIYRVHHLHLVETLSLIELESFLGSIVQMIPSAAHLGKLRDALCHS